MKEKTKKRERKNNKKVNERQRKKYLLNLQREKNS